MFKQGKTLERAVFFDRDGTINDNKNGYIHKKEDFEFLPGVIKGLKRLAQTDYKIFIVTNQSGIGRKMYTKEDFHRLNNWLLAHLLKHGVRIDKVYYCPHHPDDGCDCRKPKPGMLLRAAEEYNLHLGGSWIIGDSSSDIEVGVVAGVKTVLVGREYFKEIKPRPDYIAPNFLKAVNIILAQVK